MEFLGIGPLEIIFILIIALIILGPKDIAKTGKMVGKTLRKIVTSPTYQMVQNTSREIRDLPNRLMRESGLDELQNELPKSSELYPVVGWNEGGGNSTTLEEDKNTILKQEALAAWTTQPDSQNPDGSSGPEPDESRTSAAQENTLSTPDDPRTRSPGQQDQGQGDEPS